jgi:SAM-dependent methyltransferase
MNFSDFMDGYILLDPGVELASEDGPRERQARERTSRAFLLLNHTWQSAMVAPGAADLMTLIDLMRDPILVAKLLDEIGDTELAERLVGSLEQRGYLYILESGTASLEAARRGWWARASRWLRGELCADLTAEADADALTAAARAAARPPNLVLEARSLAECAGTWSHLREERRAGRFPFHTLRISAGGGAGSDRVAEALFELGAIVEIEGSPDRALPGWIAELIQAAVPVFAAVPFDAGHLDRVYADWARRHRLAGLRLHGWADALEAGALEPPRLREAAERLEDEIGWLELDRLPTDAVVFGEELPAAEPGTERSEGPLAARYRRLHLVSRARAIRAEEGLQVWAQMPSAEDLWVPSDADYVPRHPAELGLAPGVRVADIAAGFGRVARRIAPLIAPGGGIVCVEKASISVDRARRFAAEGGFSSIVVVQGLAQRLPLATGSFDLAIMEWAGHVMRTLAAEAVAEMTRVVRVGGRVVVTHRLVQLILNDLTRVESHVPDVFAHFQEAFARDDLTIEAKRFWGCQDHLSNQPTSWFEERFLPRVLAPAGEPRYGVFDDTADIYLTMIARKRSISDPATGS